jgi:hypothetical protein
MGVTAPPETRGVFARFSQKTRVERRAACLKAQTAQRDLESPRAALHFTHFEKA